MKNNYFWVTNADGNPTDELRSGTDLRDATINAETNYQTRESVYEPT